MPRLLYLCVHPRNSSPSQRYRFEQFESFLETQGYEIEYAAALRHSEVPTFYGPRPISEKAKVALGALGRRAWSVRPRFGPKKFDVVLVQREAFFLFGAWSEWLAHLQAPLVFDFDDAIWMHSVSEQNRKFAWLKNVQKIEKTVSMARAVIAGNDFLANWAGQYNKSVTVIPTSVDTDRYHPDPTRRGPILTIGWCGSPTTLANVRPMLPALERIKTRYGSNINIRIMGDPSFRHEPLAIVGEAWTSDAEIPFLQGMDISIMPIIDDEWSKGKCALKGLTSMACGAAVIMSPVGVNTKIVQNGKNGLLAQSIDDWFNAMCRLIENESLREELGTAGRLTVEQNFSVRRWRHVFCDTLSSCIE